MSHTTHRTTVCELFSLRRSSPLPSAVGRLPFFVAARQKYLSSLITHFALFLPESVFNCIHRNRRRRRSFFLTAHRFFSFLQEIDTQISCSLAFAQHTERKEEKKKAMWKNENSRFHTLLETSKPKTKSSERDSINCYFFVAASRKQRRFLPGKK